MCDLIRRVGTYLTRMHSSRMRTARSLIVSPYLVISHACPPPEQPCMPPQSNDACPPRATMHAPPEQPHMPPKQPHMPSGATMHAPQEQPHMPPRSNDACPPRATTHAPLEQPHMPLSNHACPPQSNHACSPGATTLALPVNRMRNRCKNITLPQTSFAGRNKAVRYIFVCNLIRWLRVYFKVYWEHLLQDTDDTLGPAYNEFSYNERPAITSRFLCMKSESG